MKKSLKFIRRIFELGKPRKLENSILTLIYLLQETGVEGDKLILDDMDIEREGRLYGNAHKLYKDSNEVKEDFERYGTVENVSRDVARQREVYEQELEKKRIQVNLKCP